MVRDQRLDPYIVCTSDAALIYLCNYNFVLTDPSFTDKSKRISENINPHACRVMCG